MRAFAYFNLVRLFGDVPMHLIPITRPDEVNIPRTPAAQVYKQIVDDLKAASTLLPPRNGNGPNNSGNEKGRPTRWTALAVLADVYLTQKQYNLALTTAQRVITESSAFDKGLNAAYDDNFPARKLTASENSRESLFEVQFTGSGTTGTAPLGNGYAFIMGASTERDNGGVGTQSQGAYRPTDNEDNANESGFTGGLIQEYEAGDLRKTVTFQFDTAVKRWLTWKHHVIGTGSQGAINFPLYRLAEVYLIYAESSNELSLLDATGLDYLNQLRRRAFGLSLTTASAKDIASGLSQDQYRTIIRSERRKELAMENKRWFDLQRYGAAYAEQVLKVNQKRTNFTAQKLLLPIDDEELINNPKLTQNPGY
jgi:hypothetical protein